MRPARFCLASFVVPPRPCSASSASSLLDDDLALDVLAVPDGDVVIGDDVVRRAGRVDALVTAAERQKGDVRQERFKGRLELLAVETLRAILEDDRRALDDFRREVRAPFHPHEEVGLVSEDPSRRPS